MEPVAAEPPTVISEAIVVWTGWGKEPRPIRDERLVVEHFGPDRAQDLVRILRRLEEQFSESDARFTVADLAEMGDVAAQRFRQLHPELTQDAIEALAWCYSYDYK